MTLADALRVAEIAYVEAHPSSAQMHARACRVLPAGHTRQTLYHRPFPLTFSSGADALIRDIDGHTYLDLVGDYAAGLYGHTPTEIGAAVSEALANGMSMGGITTRELELAELIASRIPSMEQVRFCNSGSEACLFAAQIARHFTQRERLLVFRGCYHGGFMAYGDNATPLSIPFSVIKATYNNLEETRALLAAHAHEIAAVLVEPMMGAAGSIPASGAFLQMLREETRRIGALLIFDEVMTSRLAPGGLQGLHEITPDLTTLGKFWGGGFAFGAFGGTAAIMACLDSRIPGSLAQAGTFNNNVVTLTAGLKGARDLYGTRACIELNARGDCLRDRLNAIAAQCKVDFQSTGLGAVQTLHWHRRPILSPDDVESLTAEKRRLFHLEMLSAGFYVAPRGALNLSLMVSSDQLEGFLDAVMQYVTKYAPLLCAA